jgi:ribA/ribD-fused uncharacterized protein
MSEEFHKLDTLFQVYFYEQDYYCLSNFSAFTLEWKNRRFDTSEAAYQWEKFLQPEGTVELNLEIEASHVRREILFAKSAHEAFKLAEANRHLIGANWENRRVGVMKEILREKVKQHEYVRRKLLNTGTRLLIEDSWRDSFWGWGPDQKGKNQLGELWMEIRAEIIATLPF